MTRTTEHISDFINAFISWASTQPDIQAVALVGSYARQAATETSDIDLVLLVSDPHPYLTNTDWSKQFGAIVRQQIEEYGLVTSLRVWSRNGYEVEYGITTLDWAKWPLAKGTARVIQDGLRLLFEREALLSLHERR